MGMYTEINVCFDLLRNTPKDIVDILHCLVEGTDTPSILPEHKFFKLALILIFHVLDWLEPYIVTEGFIGYMRYEEWEDPTLIYNDFDNDKIVFKGVYSEVI